MLTARALRNRNDVGGCNHAVQKRHNVARVAAHELITGAGVVGDLKQRPETIETGQPQRANGETVRTRVRVQRQAQCA